MSPSLPRRLGRYEVAEVIGTGAFATVYRARDDRLDADVAVKVLAENHSFDPDLRERFISEGHLLRRVDDPHVIKVFDLDETDAGQPFLVLDLATGGDLAARRRSLGPEGVSVAEVMEVAVQVAAALEALHAEHVVHRDVTPGNLLVHRRPGGTPTRLLVPGERLLLADLGLSKDLAVASGLTVGAGTAGFTPPEQGEGGWVDPRADIWSASALLVWLATGAAPDLDGGWRERLAGQGWPGSVVDELDRGLQERPDDRHATAASWADALRAASRPAPVVPTPGAIDGASGNDVSTTAVRAARPWRRRIGVAALALALAAALVTGGWWLADRTSDTTYGSVRTEQLRGGRQQVTSTRGTAVVAITGPRSVTVGERAVFTAEATGADTFQWLAPDGANYPDEPSLVLTPTSEGTSTVRLLGQTADGDVVMATFDLRVEAG